MDIGTIITCVCLGLLLWLFIKSSMKTWYQRKEGTGHEVDFDTLGEIPLSGASHGNPGDPEMVTRIEKELNKQAKK